MELARLVPVPRAGRGTLRPPPGLAFPVAALNTREAPQDWQLEASVSLQW